MRGRVLKKKYMMKILKYLFNKISLRVGPELGSNFTEEYMRKTRKILFSEIIWPKKNRILCESIL